jgi:hypothetical protein
LHQVFGLLARADEMPRDAENLIGQVECFLFETNAITSLLGNAPGLCLVGSLMAATLPMRLFLIERG